MKLAGRPEGPIGIPASVAQLVAGNDIEVVWENQLGGLTFEIRPEHRFIKWSPKASGIDLRGEAARLSWVGPFTPVPNVLDLGGDDEGTWLMTSPVPGESAVSEWWKQNPSKAVSAVGAGLRSLHDTLPVSSCPFSWSAQERLRDAQQRAHLLDPSRWHKDHRGLGVDRALGILGDIPGVDQLVVCHGDACAPNTLITEDGRWSGHVDFGALGVADRWADLAIATWSTEWNYGPGFERLLLDAYGVGDDPERTRYYRLLWDLGP